MMTLTERESIEAAFERMTAAFRASEAAWLRIHASLLEIRTILEAKGTGRREKTTVGGELPAIDEDHRAVTYQGVTAIVSSVNGLQILNMLLVKPGWVVSRERLAAAIWREERIGESTIRAAIHRLRRNLEGGGLRIVAEAISTCQGGYRIVLGDRAE